MSEDRWYDLKEAGLTIWERDTSRPWEVEYHALIQLPTGEVNYIRATGCSCWSGEGWLEETYPNIKAALDPVGGVPDDVRDEAFRALNTWD
jgi:hypothetical protein